MKKKKKIKLMLLTMHKIAITGRIKAENEQDKRNESYYRGQLSVIAPVMQILED